LRSNLALRPLRTSRASFTLRTLRAGRSGRARSAGVAFVAFGALRSDRAGRAGWTARGRVGFAWQHRDIGQRHGQILSRTRLQKLDQRALEFFGNIQHHGWTVVFNVGFHFAGVCLSDRAAGR
jgi:hypothetical protein